MATSQIAVVRAALAAAFNAAGVTTYEYPPGQQVNNTRRFTWFEQIVGTQEHLAGGGVEQESLQVTGFVFVAVTDDGATAAGDAEDQALADLAAIETAISSDATLTGSAFHYQLVSYQSSPMLGDGFRVHEIEFTISAEAHL